MIDRTFRPDGFVEPTVLQFVERHVTSLLTWDVIMYFANNPDTVVDHSTLSFDLRRRPNEIRPVIDELCESHILAHNGDGVHYAPDPMLSDQISKFADASKDRDQRLAIVTFVLQRANR
jgi:hypothetical protein